MKIQITIECLDDDEALTHLSVIRSQLKKELKKVANIVNPDDIAFTDNNCYGTHSVSVMDI